LISTKKTYLVLLFALFCASAAAQTTYNLLGDIQTDDCEGFFEDSDVGTGNEMGFYLHGEDYTFTICVPNAISIEMTFFEFCSEADFDIMTFYDGPDVNSPQIGQPHSGLDLPPIITALSGCLTIRWVSDEAGVSCDGWLASWQVEVEEPDPPVVTFNPATPTCSTEVVQIQFDTPIPCDSVYSNAFTISGNQTISNISPLNCNAGEATDFELTFSPGLNQSAVYDVEFIYNYADDCDNEFTLDVQGSFEVNDCPLQVEVFEENTAVCPNGCVEIWAEATGGQPSSYNYSWNNGLPNSAGPHLVCPTSTTTYSVTVSDNGPSSSASDQTTIAVLSNPVIDPIQDICQWQPQFPLTATPPGGTWSGSHVSNSNGMFDPDSGFGNPWTIYTDPNGCSDSLQSEVFRIWAGYDQAACSGADPFQLTFGIVAGGTWSGPNTTPDGIFTPSSEGQFNIIYTTPDGCTDLKVVRVANIILPADMTVCESTPQFNLQPTPFGGVWSGSGIANWYWGRFNPASAGPGTHTINYEINGCSQTMEITVTQIDAGGNFFICPEEDPIQLDGIPSGGTWVGIGVSSSGLYDPAIAPNGTRDTLIYTVDGCTDIRVIRVFQTRITDTEREFCLYDDALLLNWAGIQRAPGGGTWVGPGTDNIGAGNFTPSVAGPGEHTLFYTANTCTDSIVMIVNTNTMTDTSICEVGDPIQMVALPVGGTWYGDGIINTTLGVFDPEEVGIGQHWVYYLGTGGCLDSAMVDVYELEAASIFGLENTYCFVDSAISLVGYPAGGVFSGNGLTDTIFNPILAGEGIHEIVYDQGSAGCQVQEDILVSISPPIETELIGLGAVVCPGDPVTVGVIATGGNGTPFQYQWNPNETWFASIELYPEVSTTYLITTTDNCSDPVQDEIFVFVDPPISVIIETSDPLCYGSFGFAEATAMPSVPSGYSYQWNSNPPNFTNTIYGPVATRYELTISPNEGECTFDTSVTIPFFPNVTAFFTPNPNGACLKESDPVAEFIDLSDGAFSGTWEFGDGASEDYEFGNYPVHEYPDTGVYIVTLYVENELGTCTDEYEFDVCVQPEFTLWIPDAFTPDGDGLNDVLEIVSSGIIEFELIILSRWGAPIFRMNSIDDPFWDGTFKGKPVPQDQYAYELIAKANHLGGIKFQKSSGYIFIYRNRQ